MGLSRLRIYKKPEKQIPKESKVNQGQKPEKANLSDTIDEFSTMMETGRFKKSNDMLKALNSDKTKQKKTKTASADTIHKSDWVEIKKGNSTVLAKLTWNLGLLCHQEDCSLSEGDWYDPQRNHPLIERWCELSSTVGRRVLFGFDVMNKPQYRATAIGISDTGGLQLKLDDGSEIVEHSGEIRYL